MNLQGTLQNTINCIAWKIYTHCLMVLESRYTQIKVSVGLDSSESLEQRESVPSLSLSLRRLSSPHFQCIFVIFLSLCSIFLLMKHQALVWIQEHQFNLIISVRQYCQIRSHSRALRAGTSKIILEGSDSKPAIHLEQYLNALTNNILYLSFE